MIEQLPDLSPEDTLRAEARNWVYERMALASAVIYIGLTALLFVVYVPFVENPYGYFTVAAVVPLAPAALPWLFYRYLARQRAERLIAERGSLHP